MSSQQASAANLKNFLKQAAALLTTMCCTVPSVGAGTFPGSGAPLSNIRKLSPKGDPGDPLSYPILADIAKSLVRNGFPATFFLGLDGKTGPGIDLRAIVLYQAGILKSPVRMLLPPARTQKKGDIPTLSTASIPESSGQMPSLLPRLTAAGSLENTGGGNVEEGAAAAEQTLDKGKADSKDSTLNLDFKKFAIDLSSSELKNEITYKLAADTSLLAASSILQSAAPSQTTNELAFRFWTVPSTPFASARKDRAVGSYEGSFVMMSPAGLKAITGRSFTIASGKIFACCRAKSITINTGLAELTVPAGASVLVETVKTGLIRIRVLESAGGDASVPVKIDLQAQSENLKLKSGDDLLIADHALTAADKSIQLTASREECGENWKRSNFSAKELLDTDGFLRSDLPQQNAELRSALKLLRSRLKP